MRKYTRPDLRATNIGFVSNYVAVINQINIETPFGYGNVRSYLEHRSHSKSFRDT
jgi:hypothetical protein